MPVHGKTNLLGIAASLRNARWGAGRRSLIERLKTIETEEELFEFLEAESNLLLDSFVQAGRAEGKDFLQIYGNLKKSNGESGLSNSEAALAAALWSAHRRGASIDHLSLPEYFTASGDVRKPDELKAHLMAADGLLISGPVYFGDRGSLAESLIQFIRADAELSASVRGKLYGGIAVGAKRNGGQETTLIYQMQDMMNLGMYAVGNDSDTTSQYGGTGHAGDVGTMFKDRYGLETSMGTGRRMADVLGFLGAEGRLKDRPRMLFAVLQDNKQVGQRTVDEIVAHFSGEMDVTVLDVSGKSIKRCIACDICPTHISVDADYRCIIKSRDDDLQELHQLMLSHDAIVPVVVSLKDTSSEISNYQEFVERTRYLRRGDYVFSNLTTTPLVLEELGLHSPIGLRAMTSFLRHHTVMTRAAYGVVRDGEVLNLDDVHEQIAAGLEAARRVTVGRLAHAASTQAPKYQPVGYILSVAKDEEDEKLKNRRRMIEDRADRMADEAENRLDLSDEAADIRSEKVA